MSGRMRNWTDLPEPLIAKVLKDLPFSSLLALRRVCKKWGKIIVSQASICSPNPLVRHFLLLTNGKDYICYSPQKDQWFRGSLVSVESFTDTLYLRGSAGGLLLFVCGDALIVLNPLTRYYKELPKIYRKGVRAAAIGMCYHAPSRSYLIIVAESDSAMDGSSITAVYNSLVGSWKITPGMKGKIFSHAYMQLAHSNGSFFGTVRSLSAGVASSVSGVESTQEYILARYRVQQETWREGEVSLPFISMPHVGEMDGHILLAARNQKTNKVSVWEVSYAEGKCNLVDAKGMSLVDYFSLVQTVFSGDFLYWQTHDYFNSSLLVHSMKRHSWNSARELPEDFGCEGSFVDFEPSLIAAP